MSEHVTRISFNKQTEDGASVRLAGSVSFDVSVDLDGAPENWATAVSAAFGEVAKGWLVDAMRQANAEVAQAPIQSAQTRPTQTRPTQTQQTKPTTRVNVEAVDKPSVDDTTERRRPDLEEVSAAQADEPNEPGLAFTFGPTEHELGDEPTSQGQQPGRDAVCETREFPVVTPSEVSVASEESESEVHDLVDLVTSDDVPEPSVVVSHELTFSSGLEEDSDGSFFSDVPVTDNVSTEHSHAAIRVKNVTQAETRDYTPTERPQQLAKTSPAAAVVQETEKWFSSDDIEEMVDDAGHEIGFEQSEDSDALLAALPSLNQKIGKAPTGRVPRPPSARPNKFSDRAPTGTALARLQKRLRAQRRDD